ncbi:Trans-2,3-dihydro-3-hydroxyanthranilate isomerase [Ralstonia edaphis]|uniref:Trans-2,3-dihydro-3-hydroxyanthranilate isomerase n=2 Tax=Burkholderiaceae TaxID=119060 RepID=A0AB72X0M0_9RALS|nr:Trans-2,3-dihydro-3-hydroxyanthranilate isomerase [Ralstonia sp. LMG 6871]
MMTHRHTVFFFPNTSDATMSRYAFRLLNVFAETTFGGNQLAVFEDGRGLDDATMQAIGRQFNLSEITFIFPDGAEGATARFRIFTPDYEMPFAGHPSLGTAQVVRELYGPGNELTLRCPSGIVSLTAQDDGWSLVPPRSGALSTREADPAIAGILGLDADALAGPPLWVDAGIEQLMVPVKTRADVERARPDPSAFDAWPRSRNDGRNAYVFTMPAPGSHDPVVSRFFFEYGTGLWEDPGTGSACANLGGWLRATGHALPASYRIEQGAAVGRPCHLTLRVDADGTIHVGGRVIEIGRGTLTI